MEAAAHERFRRTRAAKINYRSQLLLLLRAYCRSRPMADNSLDITLQENRRKLSGAGRQYPRIETAGRAAVLDDHTMKNAIAVRFGIGSIGDALKAEIVAVPIVCFG